MQIIPDKQALVQGAYAVIFSNQRTIDRSDYEQRAEKMTELAQTMPGFLGVESVRGEDGFGITVSYWQDEESIAAWRKNLEHADTIRQGRLMYYQSYNLVVCRVERTRFFVANEDIG